MKLNLIWKRAAALMLCLALCLSVISAQAADKQNITLMSSVLNYYTATEEEMNANTYVRAIAGVGDTLYILSDQSVVYWQPGMTDVAPTGITLITRHEDSSYEPLMDEQGSPINVDMIISDRETVYVADQGTGALYRLTGELGQMKLEKQCTLEGLQPDESAEEYTYVQLLTPVIASGSLFAVSVDYSSSQSMYQLWKFDLATGKRTISAVKDIHGMAAYKEGQLICKVYNEETIWNSGTQAYDPITVAVYDIATDSLTDKVEVKDVSPYSFNGMQYSVASDTLYYADGAVVKSATALSFPGKISAYLPGEPYDGSTSALLDSGMYACTDGGQGGAHVRGLDMPGLDAGALTIYGDYGSNAHKKFVENHPEIAVTTTSDYYSDMEKLANAIVAGEGMDVLNMEVSYTPVDRLIDKGYALDLSGYPQIADQVNAMYPALRDFVTRDGKIYGLPVNMWASGLYIEQSAWEAVGLTEEDIPTNLMDLMDFISNWEYDYGEDNPDYRLMDDTDIRYTTFSQIMTLYVAYCKQQGQEISFSTPLFRQLMDKFEQTEFPETVDTEGMTESDWDELWSKPSLMYWGGSSLTDLTSYQNNSPHTMALTPDTEPIVDAQMNVLIINSKTPRADQAVLYLSEYLANSSEPSFLYACSPEKNEPLDNPRFESDLKEYQTSLETMKKALETCEPSERQDFEQNIEYYQKRIDNQDEYRYFISPSMITTYREQIAPYLVVPGRTPLNSWDKDGNNELYTQMQQYIQKAISLDQFIKEIDKRVRMMQLEDQ